MKLSDIHDYLVRARRDLWSVLEKAPDDVLSRELLNGDRFNCIKDLLFHIPAVTDGWLHEDILRAPTVMDSYPDLRDKNFHVDSSLDRLLGYWRDVESHLQKYLNDLTDADLTRMITPHDAQDEQFGLDGLMWHIMIHEMRHTAQVCMLLRQQGIKPPSLDLLFYLYKD